MIKSFKSNGEKSPGLLEEIHLLYKDLEGEMEGIAGMADMGAMNSGNGEIEGGKWKKYYDRWQECKKMESAVFCPSYIKDKISAIEIMLAGHIPSEYKNHGEYSGLRLKK